MIILLYYNVYIIIIVTIVMLIKTLCLQDVQQDKDNDFTGFDIPIFTEEFLDHNKSKEVTLIMNIDKIY